MNKEIFLCSICNINSGTCNEDCKFCSQSVRYKADIERYKQKAIEDILKEATAARDNGALGFCLVTADKGLCGGFNFQTIKAVTKLMAKYKDEKVKVRLRGVGKKGVEFFNYNEVAMLDEVKDLSSKPDMDRAAEFIQSSMQDYMDGKIDGVTIIYNGFKNALVQELHVQQVLPIDVSCDKEADAASMLEIEAEATEKMLNSLISKYVEYNMYYALIDSVAAEHSARMQAMDAATNNAKELVKGLKVEFNKARQGAITTELIEIISGVESMK